MALDPCALPLTLSTEELAELLRVSPSALWASVRQHRPPFPMVKVGRRIVWPSKPVAEFLGCSTKENAS